MVHGTLRCGTVGAILYTKSEQLSCICYQINSFLRTLGGRRAPILITIERCVGLAQVAHPHAQQSQAFVQRCALEAKTRCLANGAGVVGGVGQGLVAGETLKIVVAQFDADGFAHVTLALQVGGQEGGEIGFGDRVRVTRAAQPAYLVRTGERSSIFEGLRNKLHWGE